MLQNWIHLCDWKEYYFNTHTHTHREGTIWYACNTVCHRRLTFDVWVAHESRNFFSRPICLHPILIPDASVQPHNEINSTYWSSAAAKTGTLVPWPRRHPFNWKKNHNKHLKRGKNVVIDLTLQKLISPSFISFVTHFCKSKKNLDILYPNILLDESFSFLDARRFVHLPIYLLAIKSA